MNAADEQSFRGDRVVKRGLAGSSPNQGFAKDEQKSRGSPTSISLPASSYELRVAYSANTRSWRVLGDWAPRHYILATIALLSIFALAGSVMFAQSMGRSPSLKESFAISHYSYPKFRLPLQNSQAAVSSLESTGRKEMLDPVSVMSSSGSERSVLDNIDNVPATGVDASDRRGAGMLGPGCNEKTAILKVYLYDLPPEFHYGMLVQPAYSKGQIWPKNVSDIPGYPGGLYQQHSPEYWLTSDLLTSNMADRRSVCTAYRVDDWKAADVIFVPFFASLSYNKHTVHDHGQGGESGADRNQELQEKLLQYLRRQPPWLESRGYDHVIVIHHPNSMHVMRDQLRNSMFVVSDFGRYTSEVANISKDIVAPYKHVVQAFQEDTTSFKGRTTLLFFQGAIVRKEGGIIRQQLYELLKDEEGVHFEAGTTGSSGIRSATAGMQGSKFCLNLAGDTPSSNRLFDSIASHCVPVIISDEIELPFEDDLDYTEFCLFVKSTDGLKKDFVINLLRSIGSKEWTKMWRRLQEVDHHFKYQYPTKPNDAVHMVWKAIARKVPSVKLLLHKEKRYELSRLNSMTKQG